MQAENSWKPPEGVLGKLVRDAQVRVEGLERRRIALEAAAATAPATPSMLSALSTVRARGTLGVIAEIKRASPSKGPINAGLDAAAQAQLFDRGGAVAISVLTEPDSFGGSPDDLIRARAAVSLPLLKKDFHIHPVQALEALTLGASAMLLIARALGPEGLRTMAQAAQDAGVEIVVEIRDEAELEWALAIDAPIIGVNNRNLETLVIDSHVGDRIIPLIPPDRVAIAESGIRDAADARSAAAVGADAILVGSSLSASGDPASAVATLAAIDRIGRGR